jgi:hypothetical protein
MIQQNQLRDMISQNQMKKINLQKLKNNQGFVILFAVTLSALLLSIALGVANVALKEIKFGTSAKDADNAFFASDTGTEQALYNDKTSGFFPDGNVSNFIVSGLGSTGTSCANVTVDKRTSTTTIVSDGYNIGSSGGLCLPNNPNSVQRELKTTYSASASVAQNVIWQNAVGVNVSGNNLTNTGPGGWGTAGASSVQSILSGDGYVEFSTNENNLGKIVGLSHSDTDQNYTSVDYGLNPSAAGTIAIIEKGVVPPGGNPVGTYVAGDIFRVSVESGVVKYYKNGALIYTSSVAPVYPLIVDSALNHTNATITNAKIFANNLGSSSLPTSYAHSRSITITGTVPSPQTNFPVLVNISSADPAAASLKASVTSSQGYDIAFAKNPDGTGLFNWEVEKYDSSTGALVVWVNLDSITNGTVFYMFYGNSSIVSQHNLSSAVWDGNYKAVWHLPNGTSLSISDSTGLNTTTNHGATATSGQIDGASAHVSGSSQYIDLGSGAVDLSGNITFEQWINASTLTHVGSSVFPVSLSNIDGSAQNGYEIILSTGPKIYIQLVSGGTVRFAGANANLSANTWYHVVGTYDGTTGKIYINGVQQTSNISAASALGVSSQATSIGRRITNFWDGTIDETRISNIARSTDWIKTEYNNQSAPASFYSIGAEQ